MNEVITWVKEHYQDILSIYGAVVAICTIIVKWTKTDKDDKILYKIISILDFFSTAFKSDDKKVIEENKDK